jgi:hypothetical protein
MWCAYAFALLALISLPEAIQSHNVVTIVAWIAQTFLQLVLLSIILVGQKLQGEKTDNTHEAIKVIHKHLGIGEEDGTMGKSESR